MKSELNNYNNNNNNSNISNNDNNNALRKIFLTKNIFVGTKIG